MNAVPDSKHRLQSLLVCSADGSFPEQDRQELNTILRHDTAARRFAAQFLMEDALLADALASAAARRAYVQPRRPAGIPQVSLIIALSILWVLSTFAAYWGQAKRSLDTVAQLPARSPVIRVSRITQQTPPPWPDRGPIAFACVRGKHSVIHFVDVPLD